MNKDLPEYHEYSPGGAQYSGALPNGVIGPGRGRYNLIELNKYLGFEVMDFDPITNMKVVSDESILPSPGLRTIIAKEGNTYYFGVIGTNWGHGYSNGFYMPLNNNLPRKKNVIEATSFEEASYKYWNSRFENRITNESKAFNETLHKLMSGLDAVKRYHDTLRSHLKTNPEQNEATDRGTD